MPKVVVLKKSMMARKRRAEIARDEKSEGAQKGLVWVYKPLDLPYESKHLTAKQIKDAVDKLPA